MELIISSVREMMTFWPPPVSLHTNTCVDSSNDECPVLEFFRIQYRGRSILQDPENEGPRELIFEFKLLLYQCTS